MRKKQQMEVLGFMQSVITISLWLSLLICKMAKQHLSCRSSNTGCDVTP
jgi:hypothetical protein